jgi:outer membrane protein OmpA-like peptidoglycan-associated protein
MKLSRLFALVAALSLMSATTSSFAAADDYDDSQSNPFRIAAYILYPAAFLVEWTVFRPFHWLVSATEPQEAVFGHTPHPPILADPRQNYDYSVGRRVLQPEPKQDVKPVLPQTAAEPAKVADAPTEKTVIKEVTKVVEVPKIIEVPKIVEKIVEVEKLVFPSVAFRFDSAELTELGRGQIYLAAQRLKEKPELTVVIQGYTDSVGNEEYNQQLGMRRAQTVINELANAGIDRSRMAAATYGEDKPLINQNTDWARAVNRRVEFQVKQP